LKLTSCGLEGPQLAMLFDWLSKRKDNKGLKLLDITKNVTLNMDMTDALEKLKTFFENNGSVQTLIIK
jgi:hypothetical protein